MYQLTQMYPLSFEFNTKFLLKIAYHYHSALYGTFICDSYQELKRWGVMEKTISLWSKLLSEKEGYVNCYFK